MSEPISDVMRGVPSKARSANDPRPWRPIETAPKDGTEILVWCPKGMAVSAWTDFEGMGWGARADGDFTGYEIEDSLEPTHWTPLPKPPSDQL